jgi:signal transduction histidine kinase
MRAMDTKAPRILLVDNDEDHVALVRRAFEGRQSRATLMAASCLNDAKEQIAISAPDLVIADLRLPDGQGSDLMSSEAGEAAFPVIILTGSGDEQMAVEAMKAGALDYVVKSAETFGDMPQIADRALREWGHILKRRNAEVQAKMHLAELAHVSRLSTMGEIISELAHDINQPLYAIANFAEAATHRLTNSPHGTDEELLGWMRRISEQAKRAGDVIRSLSRFIRKASPDQTPHDINTIVRDVIRLVEVEAANHDVTIDLQLAEQLPMVTIDAVQIDQVVVNLVRNAIEAMSEVSVDRRQLVIRTSLGNALDNGDDHGRHVDGSVIDGVIDGGIDGSAEMITVSVTDRGKGIDPAATDQMFDPYFTTKADGMGMGLPISRSIIKGHQGHLWARSETQGGTTFLFSLPLMQGDV